MSYQNSSGVGGGSNIMSQLMSAGRLLFDGRVPLYLKLLLPVAALIYWVWPIDLMPGLPIDDVAVMGLALYFFVQLASQALDNGQTQAGNQSDLDDDNVVDTSWHVID